MACGVGLFVVLMSFAKTRCALLPLLVLWKLRYVRFSLTMTTFPARDGVRRWPVRSADECRQCEVRAPATARLVEAEVYPLQTDNGDAAGPPQPS